MKIHRYKSFEQLVYLTLNVGLIAFYFGFSNGYFNSLNFDDVVRIYDLGGMDRAIAQAWTTGVLSLTGFTGTLLCSYLLRVFSRRKCLLIVDVAIIIISLLLTIPNIWVLLACRAVQGVCIGVVSSLSPLVIRQLSPTQISATLGPINQISILLGVVFSFFFTYVLSIFFSVDFYWRIVFAFPIIPASLQMYNLIYRYPFETPKYHVEKGQINEARSLIQELYKQEYVEEVLSETIKGVQKSQGVESQIQMKQLKSQVHEQLVDFEQTLKPKKTYNRVALIASLHLSAQHQLVGTGAVIAYSGEIMLMTLPAYEKSFPILLHSIALIGVFASIPCLRVMGRKGTLVLGSIFLAAFLILFGLTLCTFDTSPKPNNSFLHILMVPILLLLVRLVYSMSIGPTVWFYVAEIIPARIVPLAIVMHWFSVGFVNTMFPIFREWFGGNPGNIFLGFGIYCAACAAINWFILIQTSNKTEAQIRDQFDRKFD